MKKWFCLILALACLLFAGSFAESGDDGDWDGDALGVDALFDGTWWESGDLQLESVWQDGSYRISVLDGESRLSYLCAEDPETGYKVSTGAAEGDAGLADQGGAVFRFEEKDNTGRIIWQKPDGSETAFTRIEDPLDRTEWYAENRTVIIYWRGQKNYEVVSLYSTPEEYVIWTYECVLEGETLSGSGQRNTSSGSADTSGSFTFGENRSVLTWRDDAEGIEVPFEAVDKALTQETWANENGSISIFFSRGYYDVHVFEYETETESAFLCSFDPFSGTLTALEPSRIDFDALKGDFYLDPALYTGTAVFVKTDADHLVWQEKDETFLRGF